MQVAIDKRELSEGISELIKKYENYLRYKRKSEHTIVNYISTFKIWAYECNITSIDDIQLFDIDSAEDYQRYLLEKYMISTCNKKIKQLSSIFKWLLERERLIDENSFKMLPNITNVDSFVLSNKVISDENIRKILNYHKIKVDSCEKYSKEYLIAYRNMTMVNLLINCGLRVGELSSVRIRDIDFANNKIYIRGKGGRDKVTRFNFFNNSTKNMLKTFIDEVRVRMKILDNNNYLFITEESGVNIQPQSIRTVWYKTLDNCHIEKYRVHDVRHTVGSRMRANGESLQNIASFLGHSVRTSEKYYSHALDSQLQSTSSMNDDLFIS